MKKPSTTVTRRSGKLQNGQLTIELDLGDRSSFYCVLNRAGDVILEERVPTSPEAMRKRFEKMPESRIALETGTHSPWVSRLLTELGHEAIVAHSRNVRLIGESRRKDDRLDAQALARLARIDPPLLSSIQHRSAQAQADLTVIRARCALVRARTALVCAARGLTKSFGERIRGRNPNGFGSSTTVGSRVGQNGSSDGILPFRLSVSGGSDGTITARNLGRSKTLPTPTQEAFSRPSPSIVESLKVSRCIQISNLLSMQIKSQCPVYDGTRISSSARRRDPETPRIESDLYTRCTEPETEEVRGAPRARITSRSKKH
jgi:hypothetical protein